ncbi:hypothetical protein F503_08462 [Ophiostoma piceae UAMH 11346]|uniref:Uncharacterized protein n=1 Tax=Ophiostoma piceae (strain UAMH 11346) TaxID=1262450 RepID=S3C2F3_OPHP1|nr:hypothetical protein F503_08462 [Ophiostoma piceae UAMH 11346]
MAPVTHNPSKSRAYSQSQAKYLKQGRRNYGMKWYEDAVLMLNNRNIYVSCDRKYKRRQAALRQHEKQVDGVWFPQGICDPAWKKRWDAIIYDMQLSALELQETSSIPADDASTADAGYDAQHDQSGYSTFVGTPESLPELPSATDKPQERLEYDRQTLGWNLEEYYYNKCLLDARLTADERSRLEDAIGNQKYQAEVDKIEKLKEQCDSSTLPRDSVAFERIFEAFRRQSIRLTRLQSGESFDVVDKDFHAAVLKAEEEEARADRLRERGPKTRDELEEKLLLWERFGLVIAEHDSLVALYKFKPIHRPLSGDDNSSSGYQYLNLCRWTPATRPQPTLAEMEALVKAWREGLILNEKEIRRLVEMYGFGSSPTHQRQRAPSRPSASPKSKPDAHSNSKKRPYPSPNTQAAKRPRQYHAPQKTKSMQRELQNLNSGFSWWPSGHTSNTAEMPRYRSGRSR